MNHLPVAPQTTTERRWSPLAAIAALVASACGGGAEALFIPFFSFTFTGAVNGADLTIFLKPSDDCSVDGTLPTAANLSLVGAPQSNITGTYSQRMLTITLETPPPGLAKVYDGRFDDRDTLVFTPRGAGAALTVKRNTNGGTLRNCP